MKRLCLFLLLIWPSSAIETKSLERDLDQVARVATAMVDGDVCEHIVTPRAIEYMLRSDKRDPWASGDNYDVDEEAFIATKKTLMRLAQLVDYPVDVNLWMPLPTHPERIQIVVRNRYEMSQFWQWGDLQQDMIPPMRSVFETGKRTIVKQRPGFVSVVAPVRNSLGDRVGIVEVVSRLEPDARENVK